MDPRLRELVQRRARCHCEYCGFPDQFARRPFHCDHVIAQQHGGETDPANLAWACNHCNLHKGPNLASIDPQTGQTVRVFNPRSDSWDEHFRWERASLVGKTPIGRATVSLLEINDSLVLATRAALMKEGVYSGARL